MERWQDLDATRQWRKERRMAVQTLDTEIYRAFYKKWSERGYSTTPLPKEDEKVMRIICTMATELDGIPGGRREEAREWLRVHEPGYNLINRRADK